MLSQPRYWTQEEHRLFMDAVQRYGWKDVKSIAQAVGTRTPTQVRTHAQKLFLRHQKESTGVMQPAKNGRVDMNPDMMPAIPADLMGDEAGGDQMQALQEAGYLAQMQDAAGAPTSEAVDGGSIGDVGVEVGVKAEAASLGEAVAVGEAAEAVM